MKRIIAGGSGFIGSALVKHWESDPIELIVVGRDLAKLQRQFGNTVTAMDWETFQAQGEQLCRQCDCIINLCGANIGNKRWSTRRKKILIDSRTGPTEILAKLCAQCGDQAPRLFNASGVGIYGLQKRLTADLPPACDETTELPHPPTDFLARLSAAWEAAAQPAVTAGVNVIWCRFGVVLDRCGGILPRLTLPFKLGVGGIVGTGEQPFCWVSLVDLLRIFDFLIAQSQASGAINCVSMQTVKQKELARSLARSLHRPCLLPLPGAVVKGLLGQMGRELLLNGQHVVPTRLTELGFEFNYPTLDSVLDFLYSKNGTTP